MIDVSNPDRLMFPDAGISKRRVVEYYEAVAERMLAHVANRPLTLHRFPNGIGEGGFMQKNASSHFPATIERFPVAKRDGGTTTYPVVVEAAAIPYLANQGTVAFHVWTSTTDHPDRPDRIVFDLDPPAGEVAAARAAARHVRDALEELGLPSIPMTTGSNGYHVFVAIEPSATTDVVSGFSRGLAELLAREHSDTLTTEFRVKERKGRVFVDWLRNNHGQTGIAPWSLRARSGAPAAAPIEWHELDDTPPARWDLDHIRSRLAVPDPLAELAAAPVAIAAAVERAATAVADAGIELEPFDRFRS